MNEYLEEVSEASEWFMDGCCMLDWCGDVAGGASLPVMG